jgi:tripartite-type tricarboxylate transporter receptor subunit TctC
VSTLLSRRTVVTSLTLTAISGKAFAQSSGTYPNRTIQIVVPYPPGGAVDLTARLIADKLRMQLGQTVVVENRAGANGLVGTNAVARAEADGYTLLVAPREVFGINPVLQPQQAHDWQKDLAYVGIIATGPYVLVVNPDLGVAGLKELVAFAKLRELNYASFGNGSMAHLNIEAFCRVFGLKMNHVPYRGAPPAVMAVATGEVALTIATPPAALSLMHEGRVKAVVVGGTSRLKQLPDIPSMGELGVANDPLIPNYFGMAAPAKTPPAVIETLNAAIAHAAALPDVVEKFEASGLVAAPSSPTAMAESVAKDIARFGPLITDLGIKLN